MTTDGETALVNSGQKDKEPLTAGIGASFASNGSVSGQKQTQKTTGTEELVRSIISAAGDENMSQFLCLRCPGNVMVLLLTTFLFALITVVQYSFARIGHVNALLSDCKAMACDTLSYFLNIFAELAPRQYKRKLQLVIPVISLSVLAVLVVSDFLEALEGIKCGTAADPAALGCDDEPEPSVAITFVFGFAGLVFDSISICAFCKNRKRAQSQEGGLPVNMLAAFMHVGADFIRSATTTFESFWLWTNPPNGDLVDAYCCVVIDVTIMIGIFFGLLEVARDLRVFMRTGE